MSMRTKIVTGLIVIASILYGLVYSYTLILLIGLAYQTARHAWHVLFG